MSRRQAPPELPKRPEPKDVSSRYAPAPELEEWVRSTFIEPGAALLNPDHVHLRHATIGFLWAFETSVRSGRQIWGTADIGKPRGLFDPWIRGQREELVTRWFGLIPSFIVTIDATYFADEATDAAACALIEHELYHCAQATDMFGMPKFDRDGVPMWKMRPHDVEEFIPVVQRYGVDATYLRDLRAALDSGPTIAAADIKAACGTCRR